jgi:hypothetical protein
MLRGPLIMATFGLAFSAMLWIVPAMVAASAAPHLFAPNIAPTLAQVLATAERTAGLTPSLPDALMQLIGAESEALEVAGLGLQQPRPADLAARADHASARVLDAVRTYIRSASAVLNNMQGTNAQCSRLTPAGYTAC